MEITTPLVGVRWWASKPPQTLQWREPRALGYLSFSCYDGSKWAHRMDLMLSWEDDDNCDEYKSGSTLKNHNFKTSMWPLLST